MEDNIEEELEDNPNDNSLENTIHKQVLDIFEEANVVPYNQDMRYVKKKSEYLKQGQDLAIGPNEDIVLIRDYDDSGED
jgi:hypothetical protein